MITAVTLRIFFVGMIAFAQDNGTIRVYLPSSGTHEMHYPFLLYKPDQWSVSGAGCGTSQAMNLSRKLLVNLTGDACRELGNISISNLESPPLNAEFDACRNLNLPRTADECKYFCWVPNMDRVSNGTASTIQKNPDNTGFLSIGAGELETFEFAVLSDSIHSMVAREGFFLADWEKAVSEIVLWTVKANSPTITLGSGASLTLNGSPATVDLVIGNMPSKPQDGSFVARHFERYYEIAENRRAKRFIPQWWPWPWTSSNDVCTPSEPPDLLKPFDDAKRLGSIEVSVTAGSDLRDNNLQMMYVFQRSICPQVYFTGVAQDQ